MATYRQYIGSYTVLTLSGNKECNCYLRVETSTDIVKNRTEINYYLDREGEGVMSDHIKYQITLNGNESHIYSRDTSDMENKRFDLDIDTTTHNYINHYEDGSFGTVSINLEMYANYSELLFTWFFHESCSLTFEVEDIDRSTPEPYISNVSADRFGKNASVSFRYEQFDGLGFSRLSATKTAFTLRGLDYFQAVSRTKESLKADSVIVSPLADGTYSVTAERLNNINQNTEYVFSLDSSESQDIAPLESGKSYEFEISVTSENGNTGTVSGILSIPQRVTAFSCESDIDIVMGENEALEYSVYPPTAQIQSVRFETSDSETADISLEGIISPVSEGSCKITVIPDDDGAEPFLASAFPDGGYFRTSDGKWVQTDKIFSQSTGLVKVSSTDVFVYKGKGGDDAASVLWYDENRNFISAAEHSGTIAGTSATAEIHPPENAAYVRFQSFGYSAGDTELDTVRYAYGAPFRGECIVTVALTQGFPELPENVQYLTAKLFSKINIAAEFLRDELTEQGAHVEAFADNKITGRNHPVSEIMRAFSNMELNCEKLRRSAVSHGTDILSLPESPQTVTDHNSNWYTVVNTWIAFLNELHSKLNGGG